jgi:hypothetical protein
MNNRKPHIKAGPDTSIDVEMTPLDSKPLTYAEKVAAKRALQSSKD